MKPLLPLFALLLSSAAIATPLNEQLRACASIERDTERLGCYDALSAALGDLAVRDFGRERQRIEEEAPQTINATIATISLGAHNKLTVTLDNGQVWQQTDSVRVPWKAGEEILLERGALGSFFMKKPVGGRSIRVRRVQ